jgi:DNA-binding transcriptional LysR family regulator
MIQRHLVVLDMTICHDRVMPTRAQVDVESLRTLLAVLDHGSMTRAARSLDMSQSAVSWKIKRLESRVGHVLIDRDGRALTATRAARTILDDARAAVEAHDRVVGTLSSPELSGGVTVAAEHDLDLAGLTRLLGSFRRTHPAVEVDLVVDSSPAVTEWVRSGDVDIGILEVTSERMVVGDVTLRTDSLMWVTGRTCPHLDGIVPIVTYGEDCLYRALGEPALRSAGIDYRIALAVPTTAGVVSSVEDGLGVAVVAVADAVDASDRVRPWARGGEMSDMPPVHTVVRIADRTPSATVSALAELIVRELSAEPYDAVHASA